MKFEDILLQVNIAELLDQDQLDEIGRKVVKGVKDDLESRAEWEERNADAIKLALQVREEKTVPWPNAANVHYPLVTVACMQFNARAYPALIPNSQIVKHRVIGRDDDGQKVAKAKRVSSHMNFQLAEEEMGFEDGVDRMLMTEPLLGCSFQKSYFNGENPVSEHVTPDNFVVNYFTKSLEEARRKTHILYKYSNEITSKVRLEEWLEVDLKAPKQIELTPA